MRDDATSFRRSRPGLLGTARTTPPMPPRFAFVKTPAWADADPDMQRRFGASSAALGERAVEIDIPALGDVIEWQRIVQLAENAHYYGPLMHAGAGADLAGLHAAPRGGARRRRAGVSARDHRAASRHTARLPRALERLQRHPHARGARARAGGPRRHRQPDHERAVDVPRHAGGIAAAARGEGLPVGVQLVGLRHDEARLLRTARWLADEAGLSA